MSVTAFRAYKTVRPSAGQRHLPQASCLSLRVVTAVEHSVVCDEIGLQNNEGDYVQCREIMQRECLSRQRSVVGLCGVRCWSAVGVRVVGAGIYLQRSRWATEALGRDAHHPITILQYSAQYTHCLDIRRPTRQ